MGYHPRREVSDLATFQTTRCKNSELWFANNPKLEHATLGYLAKYSEKYDVKLYAFAIEGNHHQFPAHFPSCNRAHFMRDLNSCVARAVKRYTPWFDGGRLWQRRYSAEYLFGDDAIEKQFFYTVLQAVQDGHVEKLSQYPFYNCFHDAVYGIKRKFKVVDWAAYNQKRRWNKDVRLKDFVKEHTLEYKRLPGYEHLSQKDYVKLMHKKLEQHRLEVLEERRKKGLPPCGDGSHLRRVRSGSRPRHTKTSTRESHRPRVLSPNNARRAAGKEWYFDWYFAYKDCSKRYRSGELNVKFPPGTYKPPAFTIKYKAPPDIFATS